MWIARLTATFPHNHNPAKSQTFFDFGFNVKTDRSDSYLDWNGLRCGASSHGRENPWLVADRAAATVVLSPS